MSRYDYIKISINHFKSLTSEQACDIDGLEFQTKDLDREYLDYMVDEDGVLFFMDYHYELQDSDGLFKKMLVRIEDGIVRSSHTGPVMFYGKPYDKIYTFQAKFTKGELKYIRLLSIT